MLVENEYRIKIRVRKFSFVLKRYKVKKGVLVVYRGFFKCENWRVLKILFIGKENIFKGSF